MTKIVRSTKVTIKFANGRKRAAVSSFVDEYHKVTQQFVDKLWNLKRIPKFLGKEYRIGTNSWLSARAIQSASQQAGGIVRGAKAKQSKRDYVVQKLAKSGCHKKARKLQRINVARAASKPVLKTLECQLDARFVTIDTKPTNSFDGWVTLGSLGNKLKIAIPFKKTKHFNKLARNGSMLRGVRLNKTGLTFMFVVQPQPPAPKRNVLGIDIGQKNCITASNGFASTQNKHGHNLDTITTTLVCRVKGSKGFKRAQKHRTNYINWTVNQLNLAGVSELHLENIKNLRKGKTSSKALSHWNYADIFGKLESKCELAGVPVVRINPTYTSQRCNQCGWVRKGNRKGKLFKCTSCGHTVDADLNASRNIALDLPAITKGKRLLGANRKGFYWQPVIQEPIVPVA